MKGQIPRDARPNLRLPWHLRVVLAAALAVVKLFRLWRYPRRHDPEKLTILNGIYWVRKSMVPVTRAERGSGLEEHFRGEHEKEPVFLPEGFTAGERITLSFTGDLMNAPGLDSSGGRFYERAAPLIFDADVSVANLESTLTREEIRPTTYSYGQEPLINATFREYERMTRHGDRRYDIFHLANNHILDRGMEGFTTTLEKLKEDGMRWYGVNEAPGGRDRALIFEKNGFRLGFSGWTYSINSRPWPSGKDWLVNFIPFHDPDAEPDISPIERQIDYCATSGCDFTVLSLHWGIEYELYPQPRQVRVARRLAERGADLVVSHHAHCIQPFEYYRTRRDPSRVVPILYGLGNLAATKSNPHIALSLIAGVTLARSAGTTLVESLRLTPVFQIEHDEAGAHFLRVEILKDMIGRNNREGDSTAYTGAMARYADLVIGRRWRG